MLDELYELEDVHDYKNDAAEQVNYTTTYDNCRIETCFGEIPEQKINKPDCEELASTYTADFMPGGQYLENRSIDDDSEFEPNHTWMNLHIKSYKDNGDLKYDFYELVDKKKWNGGWNWKYYTLKKNALNSTGAVICAISCVVVSPTMMS